MYFNVYHTKLDSMTAYDIIQDNSIQYPRILYTRMYDCMVHNSAIYNSVI